MDRPDDVTLGQHLKIECHSRDVLEILGIKFIPNLNYQWIISTRKYLKSSIEFKGIKG